MPFAKRITGSLMRDGSRRMIRRPLVMLVPVIPDGMRIEVFRAARRTLIDGPQ